MNLKAKRQKEYEEIKQTRIDLILHCAFELFSLRGIDTVTMTDIAEKAEIGVASLYRYFQTKEELAIQCAENIWKEIENKMTSQFKIEYYEKKSGIKQLEDILNLFSLLYESHKDFFRFIYFFDSFIYRNSVSSNQLNGYEKTIGNTQNLVLDAINKGFQDGTISMNFNSRDNLKNNKDKKIATTNVGLENSSLIKENAQKLYFTLTQSLFSLAQKKALSEHMLSMDNNISGSDELKILTTLLINSIKQD